MFTKKIKCFSLVQFFSTSTIQWIIFLYNFSLLGFVGLQPIEKVWKCEPIKEVPKYPDVNCNLEKPHFHYRKDLSQSSSEKATFSKKVHKRSSSKLNIQNENKEINKRQKLVKKNDGKLKWGTIIPLIGGSSIGCSKSAGNLPAFHLTYTPFKDNEAHLERYWPTVPKYYIDKDEQPENMTGKIFSN